MLDTDTKRRIDTARDILVGKVPDPKSQVEQITIALIYKFMDDMDAESEEFGGKRKFFAGEFARYGWAKLMRSGLGGHEILNLYAEAITKMPENPGIPLLFREIFKRAYLPYRDPETLKMFLKVIDEFNYDHSERLGDAYEYLLSVLGSQGNAGQFRTPRHIIDFMVEIVDPKKTETMIDPACGTAGFLISAYKHILANNRINMDIQDGQDRKNNEESCVSCSSMFSSLTPDEKGRLAQNFKGYDIDPLMVRLSLVNMYLHGFTDPHIYEYDTLTSEERWNEFADVILANPPFMSPKGGIKPHKRFSIQAKRSEVLFVDYMAEHLTPNGRAGIIVPEGIIFQSQTAYKQLRKMLVENYLVAVVSLPAGVFNPYSGVKTSILILDKVLAKQADTIAFFKVENDGFGLGAQRREIDKNDLPNVATALKECIHMDRQDGQDKRKKSCESCSSMLNALIDSGLALIVPKEKIAANGDYNLSGERYREGEIRTSNYPTVPIGDICELFNGRAFKPEDWERPDSGGIPIVRIQNLNTPDSAFNYFTGEVSEKNTINNGELLFSWSGSRGTSFGAHIWKGGKAVLNQHIFKIGFDESRATKMYLLHALNRAVIEVEENLHGGVGLVHITKGNLEKIEIPLPPLEVQKEIVAEIEGYQKVINGARAVLDHYRPHIPIHPDWPSEQLGKLCRIRTGKKDVNSGNPAGKYPFFTCAREHTYSDVWSFDCEAILVAGNGDVGAVQYYQGKFEAYQRTYVLSDWVGVGGRYLYFCLDGPLKDTVSKLKQGNTMPYIKLGMLSEFQVPLPPLATQQAIVAEIEAEQGLVAANRELITRFEQKIQATLARVWGVEQE